MSPHPDDAVYSAFSVLSDPSIDRMVVTVFNVSRFTKWGLGSKRHVTAFRSLEDRLALTLLGVKVKQLWLPDTSVDLSADVPLVSAPDVGEIYAPLGLGSHPNHLAARGLAVELWLRGGRKQRLCFYEDMPYAARVGGGEAWRLLPRGLGAIREVCRPLSASKMSLKLFAARLYVTQTDHTPLLLGRAREVGSEWGFSFAERFFEVGS